MKIFLDTASRVELERFLDWGIIAGVTTNQKLFLAEKGVDFRERVIEIARLVEGPVSVELVGLRFEAMIEEARDRFGWAPDRIVIKVPMMGDGTGLRVMAQLARWSIPVNATAVMTVNQAVLAALAGARYVSLFFNRIRDGGEDGEGAIYQTRQILAREGLKTEVLAGSIRSPEDVRRVLVAGAHVVTVPPKILAQLAYHVKSEETIEEFDRAWREFEGAQVATARQRSVSAR